MIDEQGVMKICFLADAGTPNTLSYIQYFRGRGHEVTCLSLHPPLPELRDIRVIELGARGKWQYALRLPVVRMWLREIAPDLLIGYRLTSYGLLAVSTGFHPVAVTTTGFDVLWGGGWQKPLRRAIVGFVVRRADLIVSWADHMTSALPLDDRGERVLTQPRGIELGKFPHGSIPPGQREQVIISTRSLKRWYRLDQLLRAFAHVRRRVTGARLWILGDGPERSRLERLAGALRLREAVRFFGRVEHDAIGSYLGRASVYSSQISFDGVSASLLEAMSTGVFPVVPDNAANRQWVTDGEGGLLYAIDSEAGLARALERALTDADLRERASRINRSRVEADGDLARNLSIIENRFKNLVSKTRRHHAA
jgi:L-malate glycosyltransferase